MRGVNDSSVAELLQWCLDRGYELRFIEQMPLDAQHGWDATSMVSAAEVRTRLEERFTLTELPASDRGSAPAERFLVNGGPATVGIIASVSQPFCQACDRVRLTADGQVRNCLFSRTETDLRGPLRDGASDAELVGLLQAEMWRKARGHGIGEPASSSRTGRCLPSAADAGEGHLEGKSKGTPRGSPEGRSWTPVSASGRRDLPGGHRLDEEAAD